MPGNPVIEAADLLRAAETGEKLGCLPDAVAPRDEAAAYAIQAAVLGDAPVAAWKVATIKPVDQLQTAPLSQDLMIEGSLPAHLRAPEIEVEIAIEIARDLPPRTEPYTRPEVEAALGRAHAAIEVIESRFAVRKQAAPMSALADRSSNGAVVIGSGTDDWRGLDFNALAVTLAGNGPIAEGDAYSTQDQTIEGLVWLANHASARGMGLRAGQFVITGARIGPIVVDAGQRLVAGVERIGEVTLAV